jgi:GNAT superfamily N-acetyltransferase
VEVAEFTRKHTANVHEALTEIRRIIEALIAKRDARRDGFIEVLRKAMVTKLGHDAEEVAKNLQKHGIPRTLAKRALEIAKQQGAFTIFSLVDALTRETQTVRYAGDRTELDQKVASLLALAA